MIVFSSPKAYNMKNFNIFYLFIIMHLYIFPRCMEKYRQI